MPDMSGSAIFSRASVPRRRRMKLPTDSSAGSVRRGMNRSSPMRSLPGHEMRGEVTKGIKRVGTISITPSGICVRRPWLTT